jgi:hypothetical protein
MHIAALARGAAFVFVAVSAVLPQADARAGAITFDDLSDVLTVADTTGRITSSVCATTIAAESCLVTFSAPPHTVGDTGSPITLNVRESASGAISDVVIFSFTTTAGMIDFVSDVEGSVLDPVPGPFIVETGTVQDVASVTWTLADGSTVVDTIGFISDISEIPEPASIALLGIGLIGVGLIRTRRAGFSRRA